MIETACIQTKEATSFTDANRNLVLLLKVERTADNLDMYSASSSRYRYRDLFYLAPFSFPLKFGSRGLWPVAVPSAYGKTRRSH